MFEKEGLETAYTLSMICKESFLARRINGNETRNSLLTSRRVHVIYSCKTANYDVKSMASKIERKKLLDAKSPLNYSIYFR